MIERLIKRLLKGITNLFVVKFLKALIEGFALEYYRFIDFKDEILISVVPNKKMSVNSIADYNRMYGIPNSLSGTDEEKINRIIERSDITGFPGIEWLQDQIRNAGYDLYIHEQFILPENILQWGDFQFADDIQFGITARFLDPATVPGALIVNQPYKGFGKIYISQYGPAILDVFSSMYGDIQYGLEEYGSIGDTIISQYGTADLQYGTPDLRYAYPQGQEYDVNKSAPSRFGFYFFLSPFPDRLAFDYELLKITVDEYNYLRKLIIGSKLTRNYCIAQIEVIK